MAGPYENLFNTLRCKMADEVEAVLKDSEGNFLPVQYDNAPFIKPTSSGWIRFSIEPGEDRQADVGAKLRRFRITGVAIASVFFPISQGDLDAISAADFIAKVFRGTTFQGVVLRTPLVQPLGREGKEWRVDVRCPFQADNFF